MKKGFTLVELLAVIAILAILAIVATPRIIDLFNDAKKDTFLIDVKEIYKAAKTKYLSESLKGNKVNVFASNAVNKLDLGNDKLNYFVELDDRGEIKYIEVSDGEHHIKTSKKVSELKKEDVEEGNIEQTEDVVEGKYIVRYNANNGTGTIEEQYFEIGVEQKLNINIFTRENYKFLGWSTSSTSNNIIYADNQEVFDLTKIKGGIVNLYAVWKYVDPTLPVCKLKAVDSEILFDVMSDDNEIVEYGIGSTTTPNYNSLSSLSIRIGTFYGYVKDNDGNESVCSIEIAHTYAQDRYYTTSYACGTGNSSCKRYKTCQTSSCGCSSYRTCSTSSCGYKTCTNSACGCSTYKTCTSGSYCGYTSWVQQSVTAVDSCTATSSTYYKYECSSKCLVTSGDCVAGKYKRTYYTRSPKSCANSSCGCLSYKSCSTSACGYRSCTSSSCGCSTYRSCENSSCGCEEYNTYTKYCSRVVHYDCYACPSGYNSASNKLTCYNDTYYCYKSEQ